MKTLAAILLLGVSLAALQTIATVGTVPITADEVTLRKEIYQDARVTVFLLDIPPGQATRLHRHDRDMLSIFVTGGKTRAVFNGGAPVDDTFAVGDVRFRSAGFTHSTENRDDVKFLSVIFEFAGSQGERVASVRPATRTCATGGQTACVDETPLLCTARFCVDDVTMAAQGVMQEGAAMPDRMLVAVSGYTLSEQAGNKGATGHARNTGEVEFIAAGPARRWLNAASTPARYVVVTFR